ncbi:hypothetical protein BBJ28_00007289, partial [Nothophytophthora sp. Chile5]
AGPDPESARVRGLGVRRPWPVDGGAVVHQQALPNGDRPAALRGGLISPHTTAQGTGRVTQLCQTVCGGPGDPRERFGVGQVCRGAPQRQRGRHGSGQAGS